MGALTQPRIIILFKQNHIIGQTVSEMKSNISINKAHEQCPPQTRVTSGRELNNKQKNFNNPVCNKQFPTDTFTNSTTLVDYKNT